MRTRVYAESPEPGIRSIDRIIAALKQYAPAHVEFVASEAAADLVMIHVNGPRDRAYAQADRCTQRHQRYVVHQYCLRSTMVPQTQDWRTLWDSAALVWSYYDLNGCLREDQQYGYLTNFYHSPLGVDPGVVTEHPVKKRFIIGMSGGGPMVEGIREAANASRGYEMFHLGPLTYANHVTAVTDVPDRELASWYAQCTYFGGLRRKEGFEMCCAEALLNGARPIYYDRIHYRQWFNDLAIFIPETSRDDVTRALIDIFHRSPISVSPDEREIARARFDWSTIAAGYWSRCL